MQWSKVWQKSKCSCVDKVKTQGKYCARDGRPVSNNEVPERKNENALGDILKRGRRYKSRSMGGARQNKKTHRINDLKRAKKKAAHTKARPEEPTTNRAINV